MALMCFPFVILGFHSDNGGEFINGVVAKLLNKLLVEQTKSRSGRCNDSVLPVNARAQDARPRGQAAASAAAGDPIVGPRGRSAR